MAETRLKGIVLVHFRDYVIEKHGEKILDELLAGLSPEASKLLNSPAGYEWYPLKPVVEIEHAIVKRLFGGDLTQIAELGRYDMIEAISKIYRILFRFIDPATIVSVSGKLWSKFHDQGSLTAERVGPREVLVRVQGHQPLDVIHCHEVRGGLLGCFSVCNLPKGRADHLECVLQGAPACLYRLTW